MSFGSMKSLNEAAINVINRRVNVDDILYFVRNMGPDRYTYMMAEPNFMAGYRDAVQEYIYAVEDERFTQAGDKQVNNIIEKVDQITADKIGNNRFSRLMDDYYVKGWAYAFQEFTRFLESDVKYAGPGRETTTGKTV